jgi:uncharacterized membrane protein
MKFNCNHYYVLRIFHPGWVYWVGVLGRVFVLCQSLLTKESLLPPVPANKQLL